MDDHESQPRTLTSRLLVFVYKFLFLSIIIGPFIVIGMVIYFRGWGFSWLNLGLLVSHHYIIGTGVTVGLHRYFTHGSFKTSNFIKFVLAVLGAMSVEGPTWRWVGTHRKHHKDSDKEGDPHSPVFNREGLWEQIKGFWHAHVGWMLSMGNSPDVKRYAKDMLNDKVVAFVDRLFFFWVALALLIPALIGGLWTHSWEGALQAFVWGGVIRVFMTHHTTWSINSICHVWGSQPYESNDSSRNNWPLAIFTLLGEPWHNTHHAFPHSARHGLKWWEIDGSWMVIWTLKRLGLASAVVLYPQTAIEKKLRKPKVIGTLLEET